MYHENNTYPTKKTNFSEEPGASPVAVPVHTLEVLRKVSLEVDKTLPKLKKRARSKFITTLLTKKLINLNSPNKGRYIKSLSCANTITHADGKITSQYCGSRWCMVCNRIRTGKYINTYAPILEKWNKSYLVTLTVPNCTADELSNTIDLMNKTVRRITDMFRKRKLTFRAVRKLEVTYNDKRNNYHPHFHFVVEGEEQSSLLLSEWLKRLPDTTFIAQDIREFDGDLREMFKYVTKLFSRDKETGKYKEVNVKALDIILRTLHGRKTFQNYGFKLEQEISEEEEMQLSESTPEGELKNDGTPTEYTWYETGWVNVDDGTILADYQVSEDIKRLLKETRLQNDS